MVETELKAVQPAFPKEHWRVDLPEEEREMIENLEEYVKAATVTKYEWKISTALEKKVDSLEGKLMLKDRLLRYTSELASAIKKPWDADGAVFHALADHVKRLLKDFESLPQAKKSKKSEAEAADDDDEKKQKKTKSTKTEKEEKKSAKKEKAEKKDKGDEKKNKSTKK